MLTLDVKWSMSADEMSTLEPGAPRRNRAISEAIELASRMGCNVNVLIPGRSYRVGPVDSLESVLGRYNEGPGAAVFRPSNAVDMGGPVVSREWIGDNAEGYRGETRKITGGDHDRGYS